MRKHCPQLVFGCLIATLTGGLGCEPLCRVVGFLEQVPVKDLSCATTDISCSVDQSRATVFVEKAVAVNVLQSLRGFPRGAVHDSTMLPRPSASLAAAPGTFGPRCSLAELRCVAMRC